MTELTNEKLKMKNGKLENLFDNDLTPPTPKEEIIIDGVNVAECIDFCPEDLDCCNANNHKIGCQEYNDCYYKQLKRAEIEIEKLKGVDGSVHPDSVYYKITRLEQENKELKGRCQKLSEDLSCSNGCLRNKIDNERIYRSALEEIKTIINQPCDNCKYNKDDITCSIGDCGEGKLKIIENKINEVLGNESN